MIRRLWTCASGRNGEGTCGSSGWACWSAGQHCGWPLRTDDLQRVGRTTTCLRSRCYLISGELGARAARFFCDFWGKVANGWLLLLFVVV